MDDIPAPMEVMSYGSAHFKTRMISHSCVFLRMWEAQKRAENALQIATFCMIA